MPTARSKRTWSAQKITFNGHPIDTAKLEVRGTRASHTLAASISGPDLAIDLAASGSLAGTTWTGRVASLHVDTQQTGEWQLRQPFQLVASPQQIAASPFCWVSGDASICGQGSWQKGGPIALQATFARLPLSLMQPFVPGD